MTIMSFRKLRTASTGAAVTLFATIALLSVAHATPDAASGYVQKLHDMLPAEIQKAGEITVASNVEYAPFEYYDTDNTTIIGLDKDFADALGQKLGVTMEFSNMSFDAIIPALSAKRFAMAISAMTDTKERRKKVDFVDYFEFGGTFLLKHGNPKNIHTLDDLCGAVAAIDKGTTEIESAKRASEKCVAAGKPGVDIKVLPGTNQIVLAIQAGRADVAMIGTSAAAYIAKQHKGEFEVADISYEPSRNGIVLPKGSDKLAYALQAAVQALIDDGTYARILEKWGQTSGAVDTATINDGNGL